MTCHALVAFLLFQGVVVQAATAHHNEQSDAVPSDRLESRSWTRILSVKQPHEVQSVSVHGMTKIRHIHMILTPCCLARVLDAPCVIRRIPTLLKTR